MKYFLAILLIAGVVSYWLYKIFRYWKYGETDEGPAGDFENGERKRLEPGYEQILTDRFPFYNSLDESLKKKFRWRLERFVASRSYLGREGLKVTEEARVLISAAAIQLTFGLNDYLLSQFQHILIYPGVFYSKLSKSHNKGETNPHGIIVFSWPHVAEGFESVQDHINLAYHEFAHALLLQESVEGLADHMFDYGYQMFNHALMKKHLSQKLHHANIFREYAFTNKMEFFAVAAEHFMESPEYLRDNCYELYDIITHMLRQDPVKKQYGIKFRYARNFWEEYSTEPEEFPEDE
jgi:MtfA peptidase